MAADLLDSFADGVFFVPLASVTDPLLVPSTIAQALDLREAADRFSLRLLHDTLRQKQLLLVLDNFEQVVAAAPIVAEFIAAAPGLRVLVTSRAVLQLYGERELPVPPLALPDRRAAPSAAHLAQFEAVHLFVDRAQGARPDFAITDENAADVAEICHRLDGLPLAIELAAARIRALPPRTMLQRMERLLPLLTGGARDLPARQQTLRGAIAWSYDLLEARGAGAVSATGRLPRLHAGRCGNSLRWRGARPGATSVALPPLVLDVLDGLESLVEKSLLRLEEAADGQAWYLMLETVREYALERLEESGEMHALQRRFILAATRLVEAAEYELYGAQQGTWMARLEQEHDNLRSALAWCEDLGYAQPAVRLAVALWWFWSVHGHLREGRERLASLLKRFPMTAESRHAGLRVKLLQAAGTLAVIQSDFTVARTLHEEQLRLSQALKDRVGEFSALHSLGTVASQQGDHVAARECLEESVAIARELGGGEMLGAALHHLGSAVHELGDFSSRAHSSKRASPSIVPRRIRCHSPRRCSRLPSRSRTRACSTRQNPPLPRPLR